MKTTLNIDDALLARAKKLAAEERTSVTRLIEEGMTLRLREQNLQRRSVSGRRRKLPVYHGRSGLARGIDPCSNESMLDAADS
ncbi:MAG: DUF2191 domain-containing protein [Wenzhouxiangellaceae bacterium]|nr:DUF2191 domain-containing protein [Wenzhouxiangellaceae bacterium]